jgi:SAM-dependent methyltransferase
VVLFVSASGFDALAPHYRWIEAVTFGPLLQWCRTALLPLVQDCRQALVLGEGNGRFLAALLETNPSIVADCLDISPAMTELARRHVNCSPRVSFHVTDARLANFPAASYDLIVANFFLDCFGERDLRRLIPALAGSLKPGGRWVIGDFRLPERGWSRLAAKAALAAMYAFFRLATRLPGRRLVDPDPLLREQGLALEHEETCLQGFLSARLWRKT